MPRSQTQVFIVAKDERKRCYPDTPQVIEDRGAVLFECRSELQAARILDVLKAKHPEVAQEIDVACVEPLPLTKRVLLERELDRTAALGGTLFRQTDPSLRWFGQVRQLIEKAADEVPRHLSVETSTASAPDAAASSTVESKPPAIRALEAVLHRLDCHRLGFLFAADAARRKPSGGPTSSWSIERLDKRELAPGWDGLEYCGEPEDERLLAYRSTLNRFAANALAAFGRGVGAACQADPTGVAPDTSDSAALPRWSIREGLGQALQESSGRLLAACRLCANHALNPDQRQCVERIRSLARPNGHARWLPCLDVEWKYPADLDRALADLKCAIAAVPVDVAQKDVRPSQAQNVQRNPIRDEQFDELILASLALRDSADMALEFPNAVMAEEMKTFQDALRSCIDRLTRELSLVALTALLPSANDDHHVTSLRGGLMFGQAAFGWPRLQSRGDVMKLPPNEVQAAIREAQLSVKEPLATMLRQLIEWQVLNCKIPDPTVSAEFRDPRRAVTALERYWPVLLKVINDERTHLLHHRPHPLTSMVENLRVRIVQHIASLESTVRSEPIVPVVDGLVDALLSSDVDALSVSEWTGEQVELVDRYIARARVQLGAGSPALTRSEELFLTVARSNADENRTLLKRADARFRAENVSDALNPAKAPIPEPPSVEEPVPTADGRVRCGAGLELDTERRWVKLDGTTVRFEGKKDGRFKLLRIVALRPGFPVTQNRLKEVDAPWPTSAILDDRIVKAAVQRLKEDLRPIPRLAAALKTRTIDRELRPVLEWPPQAVAEV